MDVAARDRATAHAGHCTRCADRLAAEQRLSGVLRAIAVEDQQSSAPAAVEKNLLTFYRGRHTPLVRRGRWVPYAALGAIAAALVLVAIVRLREPEKPRIAAVAKPAQTPEPVKVVPPVDREVRKPQTRLLRATRRKHPTPTPPRAVQDREVMTDFIPVIYDPEPIQQGRVIRVRLPRSVLGVFGLPLDEMRADEPIKADVVLGEDGLARAVRFVK